MAREEIKQEIEDITVEVLTKKAETMTDEEFDEFLTRIEYKLGPRKPN